MPAVLCYCKTFVVAWVWTFFSCIHAAVSLLEQDGSEENPLYLEEKERKILS